LYFAVVSQYLSSVVIIARRKKREKKNKTENVRGLIVDKEEIRALWLLNN